MAVFAAMMMMLLTVTACRHKRETVSIERDYDSIATLASVRTGLLESEAWHQTIILRPDTLGVLRPVEVVVHHHEAVVKETNTECDTVHTAVAETSQTVSETQATAGTGETRKPIPWAWVAVAAALILSNTLIMRLWTSKN